MGIPVTLRAVKGEPLTHNEMDANLSAFANRLYTAPFVTPTLTGFSWVNQGSAFTETNADGSILLQGTTSSGRNLQGLFTAAPSPPYRVTAAFIPFLWTGAQYMRCGIGWRQSSDGKLALFSRLAVSAQDGAVNSIKYPSPTGTSVDYTNWQMAALIPVTWVRITDDNTNRVIAVSPNGINWADWHSISRTDYLTADQIGFFVDSDRSNQIPRMVLLSWQVETL